MAATVITAQVNLFAGGRPMGVLVKGTRTVFHDSSWITSPSARDQHKRVLSASLGA